MESAVLSGRRRRALEGEAGQGCRAACVAGAWRPRGERVLTRSGAARGNSAAQRWGRPGEQASVEAGRAREVGWAGRGAGERQARWQAEPASAVGRERRRRPAKGEIIFLNFHF